MDLDQSGIGLKSLKISYDVNLCRIKNIRAIKNVRAQEIKNKHS